MAHYKKLTKGRICVSAKIPKELLKLIFNIDSIEEVNVVDNAFIAKGEMFEFNKLVENYIPCKTILRVDRKEYMRLYDGVTVKDYITLRGKPVIFRDKINEIVKLLEDDNEPLALLKASFLSLNEDIGSMAIGGKFYHATIIQVKDNE